jgi:VIT1/CCC1 family predicted Fe2+/Mn2+ transporter
MAASNYLGNRSERQLVEYEYAREIREITEVPDEEREEVRAILEKHGFNKEDQGALTALIGRNKSFFADFMLRYELGLNPNHNGDLTAASLTFGAFVGAGLLPLLPFIFGGGENPFLISSFATAISLFSVGASRKIVTGKNWIISGGEMLLVGGIAAGVAYMIGYGISLII